MTPRARSSLVAVIACGACHAKAPTPAPGPAGAWTSIWNGEAFAPSGEHPVMMFGIAPEGPD